MVVLIVVVLVDGAVVAGAVVVELASEAVVGVGVNAWAAVVVAVDVVAALVTGAVVETAVSDVADSGEVSLAPHAARVRPTATPREMRRRRECCTDLTVLAAATAVVARSRSVRLQRGMGHVPAWAHGDR